ncbi:MAG TPA: nucleotide exchange factor GrpE [Anaerolineales bacterium]|nr:nucleotide exchange factor GrpE [Anaerolineales bacterium]
MTKDKNQQRVEDEAIQSAEAAQHGEKVSSAGPSGLEELESVRAQLAQAEAKAAENLDGWQRALAEFQNFRKRVERDRAVEQIAMKGDLIKKVLPVLDDLERALQNRSGEDAWVSGIELIQRKLQSLLEAEGVKRIEAEGSAFDPNFHEAIAQEPVDGAESGQVVAVLQHGYMLGDRVIRPAQVRVAA